MVTKSQSEAIKIIEERFSSDNELSLATSENNIPSVRTVNAYYENGSFYIITYSLSNKVKQIEKNPIVSICSGWFNSQGIAKNMGYILDSTNFDMFSKLKKIFYKWYDNGHVDEDDKNTCILRIILTKGVLFSNGVRFDIDFNPSH